MRTRSEWRLALVLADRVMDTDMVRPRFAHTAITAMPHMPARLTDTTDLAGSSAASSSAPVPGSTTTATMAGATTDADTMAAADTTRVVADTMAAAVTTGVATSVIIQAADFTAVAALRRTAVVDSTAAVAEASMVEAATDK